MVVGDRLTFSRFGKTATLAELSNNAHYVAAMSDVWLGIQPEAIAL